jgi:hypothetical protein
MRLHMAFVLGREVPRYFIAEDELKNHHNHQLFSRESRFMSLGKEGAIAD